MNGTVTTGEQKGEKFISAVSGVIADEVRFNPYPGTFNLEGISQLETLQERMVKDISAGEGSCTGFSIWECTLAGVRAAILRPSVESYPTDKYELVAPVRLRTLLDVADGDVVEVTKSTDLAAPTGPDVYADGLDEFEAVVFDLDKTVVELDVDWSAVKRDLRNLLGEGIQETFNHGAISKVDTMAREADLYDEYLDLLAEHEQKGTAEARPLPLHETISDLECPVGVCTNNATSAAAEVLQRLDVHNDVDVIVGRESVDELKPHPKPLHRCFALLDVEPGNAVFIGDKIADREAAARAETSYFHPERIVRD